MLSWSSARFVEEKMEDNDWLSLWLLRTIIVGGIGPIERGTWVDEDTFEPATDGTGWGEMDLNVLVRHYNRVPNYEGAKIVHLTAPDGSLVELSDLGAAVANTTFGTLRKLASKFNSYIVEYDASMLRKRKASEGAGSSTTYLEAAVKQGDVGKTVSLSEGTLTIAGEARSVDWKDIPHTETIEETTIGTVSASFKGAVICASGKFFLNPAVGEIEDAVPRKKRPEYKKLYTDEKSAHDATKKLLTTMQAEKAAEKAALESTAAEEGSQQSSVTERGRIEDNITGILTRILDKPTAVAMAAKMTTHPPAATKKDAILEILAKFLA